MSSPIRAVAYYRMSTDRQEASIPEQKQWVHPACAKHGVEVVGEFQDPGISGDEIECRPGFLELVRFCEQEHAARRPVQAVVCWDPDRFSRANSIRTAGILSRLMDAGVTRMLCSEGWIDWDDDMERVLFNLKQDLGRSAYSKSLSKNVARSGLERARKGLWTGGRYPYGYTLGADGHLALGEPVRFEATRWVFRQYADHTTSLGQLAEQLNARGVPPPEGKAGRWTRNNVHGILKNPIYTGDLYWNRTHMGKHHRVNGAQVVGCKTARTGGGRLRQVRNATGEHVLAADAHPALVDRETFALVRRKLAGNKMGGERNCGPYNRRGASLFAGLLHCAQCGKVMWAQMVHDKKDKRPKHRIYVCSGYVLNGKRVCSYNTVREDAVLANVAEVIRAEYSGPSTLPKLRREIERQRKARHKDSAGRSDALRRQVAELDRLIDDGHERLVRMPADMVEAVAEKVRGWKAQRAAAAEELKGLDRAEEAAADDDQKTEKALAQLERLPELIGGGDPQAVREAVRSLVPRVDLQFEHEDKGKRLVRFVGGTVHVLVGPDSRTVGIGSPMT